MSSVDIAIEIYNELLELPVLTKATLIKNQLHLETSIRSISQKNKRSTAQTLTLDNRSHRVINTSPLQFLSSEVQHSVYSPDGSRTAVFRSLVGEAKDAKKLIEIWDNVEGVKLEEIEIPKSIHGDFYFDAIFSTPSWHPDGHALLYVAEAPVTAPPSTSESFKYTPDFGEKFTGRKEPAVFLLLLSNSPFQLSRTDKTSLHQLTSSETFTETTFGQPIFLPSTIEHPNLPRVIATGFSESGDGRKLGIVGCFNRPTGIFELLLSEKVEEIEPVAENQEEKKYVALESHRLSKLGRTARSPRVIDGKVYYISNEAQGPHGSCASLHVLKPIEKIGFTHSILVDTVFSPKLSEFPGLYVDQLPSQPFLVLPSGNHLVCTSIWRSRSVPLLINLETGTVICIAPWIEPTDDLALPYLGETAKSGMKSYTVLGTDSKSRVISSSSGLTSSPEVMVCEVVELKDADWVTVKKSKLSSKVSKAIENIDWTVLPLPKFEPSEIILLSPITIDPAAEARINLPPLILIPHGGPHGTTTTAFSAASISLAVAGYRIAFVNYPGSLGFGQDFITALPPALSVLDAEATLATNHYLNALSLASRTKGKRLISGGSHGGFLASWLTARYPEEFDAAILRNPVTDLPSMLTATDIPDWIYAEANLPYSFSKPPAVLTPENYNYLHNLSPSKYVDNVITPTLLLIGADDRRVPPDQGRNWYHALKANGVETEMLRFPGNGHALDSTVEVEIVNFAAGLRFLERFTEF